MCLYWTCWIHRGFYSTTEHPSRAAHLATQMPAHSSQGTVWMAARWARTAGRAPSHAHSSAGREQLPGRAPRAFLGSVSHRTLPASPTAKLSQEGNVTSWAGWQSHLRLQNLWEDTRAPWPGCFLINHNQEIARRHKLHSSDCCTRDSTNSFRGHSTGTFGTGKWGYSPISQKINHSSLFGYSKKTQKIDYLVVSGETGNIGKHAWVVLCTHRLVIHMYTCTHAFGYRDVCTQLSVIPSLPTVPVPTTNTHKIWPDKKTATLHTQNRRAALHWE